MGTTEYMRSRGGYAITLECGQHDDPQSPEVAYRAIRHTLAHLALVDEPAPPARSDYELLRLAEVIDRHHADDRFAREWSSYQAMNGGDVIGQRADGTTLRAPDDGFIVFRTPTRCPATSGSTSPAGARGNCAHGDPRSDGQARRPTPVAPRPDAVTSWPAPRHDQRLGVHRLNLITHLHQLELAGIGDLELDRPHRALQRDGLRLGVDGDYVGGDLDLPCRGSARPLAGRRARRIAGVSRTTKVLAIFLERRDNAS